MKIIVFAGDTQPVPPVQGGAVENLIQMFTETNEVEKEFDINVISCPIKKNTKFPYNKKKLTKYIYIDAPRKNKILNFLNLVLNSFFKLRLYTNNSYIRDAVEYLKSNETEFDLIIIENYIQAVIPLKKAFRNKRIVLHLHNDKLNRSTLRANKILNSCDSVITVSDFIKRKVLTVCKAKNKRKVQTLLNSIQVRKFGSSKSKKQRAIIRKNLGINADSKVVLFVGRITKVKGVLELIKAFKIVKDSSIKLVIVGSSWYGKNLDNDKYIENVKRESQFMQERIYFTGYVDYANIPDYYCMADVVVIPSIWDEPCSLTLFETMASGIPLITTKKGGNTEVVKEHGVLVEADKEFEYRLAEKIEKIIFDKKLKANMAADAYSYVQQFNPLRYYRGMLNILKRGDIK